MFNIFTPKTPQLGSTIKFFKGGGRSYIQQLPALVKDEVVVLNAYPTESAKACRTVIKNLQNKEMGYHDYNLLLADKELEGDYIEVKEFARKRGFGGLLRLASIIEMKANNLNKITLHSRPEAVKFHAHYGFYPDAKAPGTIRSILEDINLDDKFEDLSSQASELLEYLNSGNVDISSPDNLRRVNKFLAVFIDRCPAYKSPGFSKGLNMILTEEKLKANSDFYNNLFEKHKINFEV